MKKVSFSVTFKFLTFGLATAVMGLMSSQSATAATFDLTFTKLSGLTGGTPAGTAVYRADLSSIGFDINSISIADSNSGLGGSSGKFSGFDLDGIKLSNTLISSAADVNSLSGLSVFNFSPAGTIFTPGTQRTPADPALFGTTGGSIDNSVATLQNFDGNSTTDSSAFGFVSLGDGGKAGFNLTSSVFTTSPIYLYIGEVGDNGEVANGQISVSDKPISVPEPSSSIASFAALSLMGIYFTVRGNKKTEAA
ncbi:PEP-CTERM sorting domain-containing protein [Nostoc sp. CHAB 5715]|uniref:PEP-CTERM sorting domain-containing protein n=1 Tax=Nostoc sp. CHAB 5715 TaxID=2780400 RepID=UPI001E6310BA|nr:PEP-CTERM sorting domain-containing protein [Nostoc sp. CHAB 5715]MCC5621858.1 PEP-CTERM sorting domain-containing protein [Nostoc sp. CHAB 5715]